MKISRRALIAAAAIMTSCSSVGERTYLLSKYGPGHWEKSKLADGTELCTRYINGLPFTKEYRKNGKIFKREDIRPDGSMHSVDLIQGSQEKSTFYDTSGNVKFTATNGLIDYQAKTSSVAKP